MSRYSRFELQATSVIVAAMEVVMALVAITPSQHEPLHVVLRWRGLQDEFGFVLFILAGMVAYGSVRPKRKCRHMGLALSGLMMLVVFGMLVTSSWFSLSAGVLLVLALVAFVLYWADVHIYVVEQKRFHAQGS